VFPNVKERSKVMGLWDDMWMVKFIRDWAQQTGHDVTFSCGHCRQATTLGQCAYTANTWQEDGAPSTGGLACPHCGQETSRTAVRAYARLENARRREAEHEDEG
jgi:hypothetical protein